MGELIQMTTPRVTSAMDAETIVIVPRKKHLPVTPVAPLAPQPVTPVAPLAPQPVSPTLRLKAIRPRKRQLRFHHARRGMTVVLRDQHQRVIRVCAVTQSGKLTIPLSKRQFSAVTTGPFYVTALITRCPAVTVKYTVAGEPSQN